MITSAINWNITITIKHVVSMLFPVVMKLFKLNVFWTDWAVSYYISLNVSSQPSSCLLKNKSIHIQIFVLDHFQPPGTGVCKRTYAARNILLDLKFMGMKLIRKCQACDYYAALNARFTLQGQGQRFPLSHE